MIVRTLSGGYAGISPSRREVTHQQWIEEIAFGRFGSRCVIVFFEERQVTLVLQENEHSLANREAFYKDVTLTIPDTIELRARCVSAINFAALKTIVALGIQRDALDYLRAASC